MSTDTLAAAFASTRRVIANTTAEDLDHPTPCASWDVRALVNHIVGNSHWYAASMTAGRMPDASDPIDFCDGDLQATFDAGIRASVAAFGADGALERMVILPLGTFPGAAFLGLATADTFQHGWDLARATGQSTDLAPTVATAILGWAQASIPDAFRGPEGAPFGPPVECAVDAPAADRLACFLGRHI